MREFIVSLLTPDKIKIYLYVVIALALYAIYYRNTKTHTESFTNGGGAPSPQRAEKLTDISASAMRAELRAADTSVRNEQIAKTQKELARAENAKLRYYNNAYTKYKNEKAKDSLNLNISNIGNSLEGGLIDMFESIGNETAPDSESTPNINTNTNTKSKSNTKAKAKAKSATDTMVGFDSILAYVLDVVGYFINNVDRTRIMSVIDIMMRDENMIPAGVLMLIIALSLFFIDITA